MGMILEEDERGNVYIVEIQPGGNASRNKKVNVSECAIVRSPGAATCLVPSLTKAFFLAGSNNTKPRAFCGLAQRWWRRLHGARDGGRVSGWK